MPRPKFKRKTTARRPPEAAAPDPTHRTRYLLAENVLGAVGRPPGMERVVCRTVRAGCYRVNLVAGSRVTDSHFVVATDDGEVVSANPPLVRRYAA